MNSAAPASNSHASASASAAHAPNGKPRHAATRESGTDLFANLLSLLSSTHEPAADLATGADTATDEKADPLPAQNSTTDSSQNPLAALLGWPVAPLLSSSSTDGEALPASSALPGTSAPIANTAATAIPTGSNPALPGAANASDAARTPQPGVSLQGMVPLASTTAPDAATLAALAQTGTAGTGAPGDALSTPATRPATVAVDVPPVGNDTPAAPRHLHWRSTAGAGASVTAQALQTGPQNTPVGETGTRQALAAQTRSTVALDERFGQSLANQAPLATGEKAPVAAGASGSGSAHQDSGSGSPGAAPGQSTPEPLADATAPNSPEASAYAEATRDTDDTTAAHWGTPTLRHASLRVGEGTEEAIDIQLSMAGQEVQVDFRTDNADARASLTQDASGSLGEMLQRSGIQLGSVSVGAQNQQQGGNGRAPEQTPTTLARGRPATGGETSTPPAPVVRPRSDGSRPLDLFV